MNSTAALLATAALSLGAAAPALATPTSETYAEAPAARCSVANTQVLQAALPINTLANASGLDWHADLGWTFRACELTYDPTQVAGYSDCAKSKLLAHELGHLNGQPHSADPSNIMYRYPTEVSTACDAAKPAPKAAPATKPKKSCRTRKNRKRGQSKRVCVRRVISRDF